MPSLSQTHRFRLHRRGAALYMLVVGCAMVISILGLAGLQLARIKLRGANVTGETVTARVNARSAVHVGLARLASDSGWRTGLGNAVLSAPAPVGNASEGTIAWMISDTDGSLTNLDRMLRVTGVGRAGSATQVTSVQVHGSSDVGPTLLRGMTSTSSSSSDVLRRDKWWGQYLKPTLPSDAVEWWATSISLYCRRAAANRVFTFGLHTATASGLPTATVLDQSTINSSALSATFAWQTLTLTNQPKLAPQDGVCFCLTTTDSGDALSFHYRSGGMSEADSGLLTSSGGSWSLATDKALRYQLNGCYTRVTPDLTVVQGTWTWDVAP